MTSYSKTFRLSFGVCILHSLTKSLEKKLLKRSDKTSYSLQNNKQNLALFMTAPKGVVVAVYSMKETTKTSQSTSYTCKFKIMYTKIYLCIVDRLSRVRGLDLGITVGLLRDLEKLGLIKEVETGRWLRIQRAGQNGHGMNKQVF